MKHSAVILIAAIALFTGAVAARAADFTVPPAPHHYVTDGAGALDDSTRNGLEAELHAYEQQTKHQVIVWIGQTTGDVPLETWTGEAAHTWKIGRKGQDDGLVLFLFMRDHHVRIEVGYGLESAMPDATASQIIQEKIVPAMKAGDPNRAVADGVGAILTTITPSFASSLSVATSAPETAESSGSGSLVGFAFAILMFFVFPVILIAAFFRLRHGGRGSGGSSWISSSGSSDDSSSSSDDDFDSGGGDFGGGGASGSW